MILSRLSRPGGWSLGLPPSGIVPRQQSSDGPRAALCLLLAIAMTVGVFIVPRSAWAVGTRSFELDSLEKLSGGDLK